MIPGGYPEKEGVANSILIRIAKYKQLLRIEEEPGDSARFAGRSVFRQHATGVAV